MGDTTRHHPSTLVIHAGQHADPHTGAVSVPIYQTSTFAFRSADEGAARFLGADPGFIYTRLGNPTIQALETAIAELEGGAGALAAATGMAAVQTVYFALLEQGAHVVATDAVYGPSRLVLETEYRRFGVSATFVDSSDAANVARAMRPETRLVYVESPANPTMAVTDLAACAKIAHDHGALLCVDNTFASPLLQRPLDLGADVVLHSLTKFINGHSDVVGGVVTARDPELLTRLRKVHRNLGGTMDPHQAWLVLRGLKSLALRVERAQANAQRIAAFLEADPRVAWVRYPGLASHPQHELASRQMAGPGAVISFGVRGGFAAAKTMIESCRLATLAVSLGGIETLIEHPASMTHSALPRAEREAAGITDDLVRIAVGCEDERDLLADVDQALARAAAIAAP
ncbi:MAG: PLP-dependent transferase [Acidobacteria bacterium]|jgi:methionine-gamma-lyase|nr:PLP-dependent transferase [Thermoanaerobaculia bacterium]MDI9630778.1 PLP-dependent aspartate aminotransferase family protein [Acidobacteriota bacterium]OQC41870.1 MAG: Cystathionine gamma-synthase [Acidobacteria bacterium ADurb.Bin051]MBP7812807.1 PLP-dependent transferase [Thermoanaerobaculia bacterium]NLN11539.1 PLP-dependent transferase [Acidobacteriota bacterium]